MTKVEQILSGILAVSTICTVLGAVLPQEWAFTATLRKLGTDIRGLVGR